MLRINHITKEFPGVKSLDDVSITLERGEIRALVGENGAGKSTLIKILSGAYTLDQGEIWTDDERIESPNPGSDDRKRCGRHLSGNDVAAAFYGCGEYFSRQDAGKPFW